MQVDHGKTQRPVREAVDHAFLDRGNVVAGHDAAGDLIFKRKAGAARHRLDVEHDIAELAMAARLFLVPAALDDTLADGFAITDRRLAAFERDAITIAEPLGG